MWKSFIARVDILVPANRVAVQPTAADLDKCEREIDFVFPRSYRAFMLEVGPGIAQRYFVIEPPLPISRSDPGIRGLIKSEQGNSTLAKIYGDSDFVGRMISFGSTIGGDIFAWDPEDKRGKKSPEYGIYALPRSQRSIVKLTDDFKVFVKEFCFGDRFEEVYPGSQPAQSPSEPVFQPVTKRTAKS